MQGHQSRKCKEDIFTQIPGQCAPHSRAAAVNITAPLPAYMLTGLPTHQCIATNKMSAFMGTSVATAKYAKNGYMPWKIALFCIPCALCGSALGANIALMISDTILKIIMLVIIPLTAVYVLTRKGDFSSERDLSFKLTVIVCSMIAFIIGIYDGFYGPGTGTFLILLLTGIAGMDIRKANGLTKAINWSTNHSSDNHPLRTIKIFKKVLAICFIL